MKHKMIHYKGYFLLALAFVVSGALLGTFQEFRPFPLFAVGLIFWVIGCVKVARRNALVKNNSNL